MQNVNPHPEWKRLVAEIEPLLEVNRLFSYDELRRFGGIDVQTTRGRLQFHRAAKEILERWNRHFECVRGEGYRVAEASEHGNSASRRVRRAKRQLKTAKNIVQCTDLDALDERQKSHNLLMEAAIGSILQRVSSIDRNIKRLAAYIRQPKLPSAQEIERTVENLKRIQ